MFEGGDQVGDVATEALIYGDRYYQTCRNTSLTI